MRKAFCSCQDCSVGFSVLFGAPTTFILLGMKGFSLSIKYKHRIGLMLVLQVLQQWHVDVIHDRRHIDSKSMLVNGIKSGCTHA